MAVEGAKCHDGQSGCRQENKAIENPNANRCFSHPGMMGIL
jgi:hypothetical protein